MTYNERRALNSVLANQQYYNAIARPQQTAIAATPYLRDGLTGQTIGAIADGSSRFTGIASSSQLGVTSVAAIGYGGNAGFNDGKAAS